MRPPTLEEAVFDRWGHACVVCGRNPDEWLETDLGTRRQDKLSFHHVNGDDTDDRVENIIPLCQSCHVHIHRVDEPPYRKWHRQLPIEHRHAWNAHYQEYYEGPRLTREEAERRFGDDDGVPESVKYRKHEREDFDPSVFDPHDPDKESTDSPAGVDSSSEDDGDDADTASADTDDRDDCGGDPDNC